MRNFAHIVNPTIAPETSHLFMAQPITFETMRMAQQFAAATGEIEVKLYSAHFGEDAAFIPERFIPTPVLERSTLDVGHFEVRRKLPFLGDILGRLYAAADEADYLVYTNVDIALLPNFYVTINRLIEKGHDAFTVNRRSIASHYRELVDIPLMWAELDQPHPGWDCFVFPRNAVPQFSLGNVCLGAVNVGRILILNMVLTARNFTEFTDLHLTFHIGDDRIWANPKLSDYRKYNLTILREMLYSLKREGLLPTHPIVASMIEKMKKVGDLESDF